MSDQRQCSICGGPIRITNKNGVCIRTPACRVEYGRLRRIRWLASLGMKQEEPQSTQRQDAETTEVRS